MSDQQVLHASPLFAGVVPGALLPHLRGATVQELGTGERLLEPGQPDQRLCMLLAAADQALYEAKRRGRNRVVVHSFTESA